MSLFKCRGCEARDREIIHLLAQLEETRKQTDKLLALQAEIVSPGSSHRAVPRPLTPAARAAAVAPPPRKPVMNFPGYEHPERGPDVEIS